MSSRTSATRYAKALLDVAGADAPALEQSLGAFVALTKTNSDLRHALLSPSVPASGKRGIATAIAGRIGMAPAGVKLLELLADRDRFHLLDDLLAVFRERLLDRQKIVKAELRSAVPLPPAAVSAIEQKLSAVTGKNVSVDAVVDPSLIGGVVAKVGSTVYDGTVKSQLLRMKKQLLASG